ncbi:DoxX family protein [Desulfovibrio psychrotolerans]|uniref:Methylamine utilisation protein MauE domain-containing protein n=1 Tax=Desulfovibrio psychrotolerans TaxID=415242 RepID=A0A7J0BT57_9BACT|nr:MauE/DoxX family redox-associated membrane protein [Desulfovibrio psychrotolerans]GFM36184.1 hypothetical protein DSM19430T_08680 [Desulfovibrio psychrotolerans]
MAAQHHLSNTVPFLKKWLPFTVRMALAAVFLYAGATKLMDVQAFARVIGEFGILPHPLPGLAAIMLPVLEVVAGAGLVVNMRGSLAAVTGMTLLFMGVLGYAMAAGLTIADCGCFEPGELPEGVADGSALREAFVRDIVLLAACVYLYWSRMTAPLFLSRQQSEEAV